MAHRGLLRETFGLLCLASIFPKIEKTIVPSHTGYILEAVEDSQLPVITSPPVTLTTPPAVGVLPLILSVLIPVFFSVGDELINLALIYLLNKGLVPAITVIKRFITSIGNRLLRVLRPRTRVIRGDATHEIHQEVSSAAAIAPEDENDEWHDATETLPAPGDENEEWHDAAERQPLDELRAEVAGKDVLIASLTETADQKRRTILDLTRELKEAREREKEGNLAQKDEQIRGMSAENTRLSNQVSALEAFEESSKARERDLRSRVLQATREATKDTMPLSTYRDKLTQIHNLETDLANSREALANATTKETELRGEITALQSTEQSTRDAEEQGKKRETENDEKLELANQTAEDANKKAQEAEKKAEAAEERAKAAAEKTEAAEKKVEAAEKKVEAAEKKPTENTETVIDLQQKLKAADDSKADVTLQLQALTEANQKLLEKLESQRGEPDFEARVKRLESENAELLARLNTIDQQSRQPPTQATDLDEQFQQGYRRAIEDCDVEAQRLIGEAVEREKLETEQRHTVALAQKEKEVMESIQERWNQREAEWQANLNTAVENKAAEREGILERERDSAVQRALAAEKIVNNPDGDLKEARDLATDQRNKAVEQYNRAEAQSTRANAAEERLKLERDRAETAETEVERYKQGKKSQDGRLKNLNDEVSNLKRKVPSALQELQIQATEDERDRGWALVEEMRQRHYDHPSRAVLDRLCNANDAICRLKLLLQTRTARADNETFLTILEGADVDKRAFGVLEGPLRQVLVKQCEAVNARLVMLRAIINSSVYVDSEQLLTEIFSPRGDETTCWDDNKPEPQPSSDEDEDEDVRVPLRESQRPRRPLLGARKPVQKPEAQDPPMSDNTNIDNPLKRKGDVADVDPNGSSKRHDASKMGMRPIGGPFPPSSPQGPSSPEADDDQNRTNPVSQGDLPSPENIGEATAPQTQRNDQAYIPKPTKIPVPKQNAHVTSSERQHDDGKTTPAFGAAPFPTEGYSGFSFRIPKDVASGILPHVRKYTRLSGKTNTVLSRRRPNSSTAQPESDLSRTITTGCSDGG